MTARRWGRRIWMLPLAVLLLVALTAVGLIRSTRQVPTFYEQAPLPATEAERQQVRRGMEREILEIHNGIRRHREWEAVFTDQQLNAWLESELPREYPQALGPQLSDPRVRFSGDRLELGCRFRDGWLDVVLSATGAVYLTDRPNEIAVQIQSLRAGSLPLPQRRVLDQISQAARRSGLQLSWAQQDGHPVALLRIPQTVEADGDRLLQLESVRLEEGALRVSGRVEAAPRESGW